MVELDFLFCDFKFKVIAHEPMRQFPVVICLLLALLLGCDEKGNPAQPGGVANPSGNAPVGGISCPDKGLIGETIHCQIPNFTKNCLLFLGGDPIAINLVVGTIPGAPDAEVVEFSIPNTNVGVKKLEFACNGGALQTVVDAFEVLAAAGGNPPPIGGPGNPEAEPSIAFTKELGVPGSTFSYCLDAQSRMTTCVFTTDIRGRDQLRQAYMYGPFNRQTKDESCGKVGNRYLLTKLTQNGSENLAQGEQPIFDPYLEGERCSEAAGNCHGFVEREGQPPYCKILLPSGAPANFYTKRHQKETTFYLAGEKQDGTWLTDSITFSARDPNILSVNFEQDVNGPKVNVTVHYEDVLTMGIPGCTPLARTTFDEDGDLDSSAGTARFSCPIDRLQGNLNVLSFGMGRLPDLSAPSFTFQLGPVEVASLSEELEHGHQCADQFVWPHCAGDISLRATVSRPLIVSNAAGEIIANLQTQWVKKLGVYVRNAEALNFDFVTLRAISSAEDYTFLPVKRDHKKTHWILEVEDFDGIKTRFPGGALTISYPATVRLGHNAALYPSCEGNVRKLQIQWGGSRHIDRITNTCGFQPVTMLRGNQEYSEQSGNREFRLSAATNPTCASVLGVGGCRFKALDFDGRTVSEYRFNIIKCCP